MLQKACHTKVVGAFLGCSVRTVQIVFETIRVTFTTDADFQKAKSNSGVYSFDLWCPTVGGGPPTTIVHIFDYPFESPDDEVSQVMKDFGDCPNKDKCRSCGQSGHFARDFPNPWGTNQGSTADGAPSVVSGALDPGVAVSTPPVASASNEAPTLARDDVSVLSTPEVVSESPAVVVSPSGEAPSSHLGASEVASGSSAPSCCQSLVGLDYKTLKSLSLILWMLMLLIVFLFVL